MIRIIPVYVFVGDGEEKGAGHVERGSRGERGWGEEVLVQGRGVRCDVRREESCFPYIPTQGNYRAIKCVWGVCVSHTTACGHAEHPATAGARSQPEPP